MLTYYRQRGKPLLGALLLACGLAAQTQTQAQALVIGGDDDYAPYSYQLNGRLTGIYTDIITLALARMGERHRLQPLPWKRGLERLKNGQIDLLYPPYKWPAQRPYMMYSVSILRETPALFCRAEQASKLKRFPDDFLGLALGRNAGFLIPEVDQAAAEGRVYVQEASDAVANIKKMLVGRIDCYVSDRLVAMYELQRLKALGVYDGHSIKEVVTFDSRHGYLGVHKDAPVALKQFIERFNRSIETMKVDGSIEKVIKRYVN